MKRTRGVGRIVRRAGRAARLALRPIMLSALVLLLLAAGCEQNVAPNLRLQRERDAARDRARALRDQVEDLAAENRRLREQLGHVTTADGREIDLATLPTTAALEIGRHSGGLDEDGLPGHDVLVVYLHPVDAAGDTLKAAGQFSIRVFDLARPDGQTELYRLDVSAEQARTAFASGLLARHFAFRLPLDPAPTHEQLTLRAEFIETLTGRTFAAQQSLRVVPPPHKD